MYRKAWLQNVAPSWSLVSVLLPSVNSQIKSVLMEPLGPRAGARPGLVASQVASIRWWPDQDSKAANPKLYGAAPLSKAQRHKKQKQRFQSLHSFSLLCVLLPTPGLSLILCFCLSHPVNVPGSPWAVSCLLAFLFSWSQASFLLPWSVSQRYLLGREPFGCCDVNLTLAQRSCFRPFLRPPPPPPLLLLSFLVSPGWAASSSWAAAGAEMGNVGSRCGRPTPPPHPPDAAHWVGG